MSQDSPDNNDLQAQMSSIFDDLKKQAGVGAAIDKIFDTSKNLDEIQSKIILLIKKYVTDIYPPTKGKEFDEQTTINNITKTSKDILDDQFKKLRKQSPQEEIGTEIDKKDQYINMSDQAKNNFKNLIKNFAIYEIYKVMNPRRIAGETKKDNYKHNMIMGGQKLAGKYEGGKESEISKYSQGFKDQVTKQAKQINKTDGWIRSK